MSAKCPTMVVTILDQATGIIPNPDWFTFTGQQSFNIFTTNTAYVGTYQFTVAAKIGNFITRT
jgi:hypothetical protein